MTDRPLCGLSENDLMWILIPAIPAQLGRRWHVERRNIIRGARVGRGDARVSNGLAGQCDLFCVAPGAIHIELETKAAAGVLSDEQKAWRDRCCALGIPYLALWARHDEASGDAIIARWLGEIALIAKPHFVL